MQRCGQGTRKPQGQYSTPGLELQLCLPPVGLEGRGEEGATADLAGRTQLSVADPTGKGLGVLISPHLSPLALLSSAGASHWQTPLEATGQGSSLILSFPASLSVHRAGWREDEGQWTIPSRATPFVFLSKCSYLLAK